MESTFNFCLNKITTATEDYFSNYQNIQNFPGNGFIIRFVGDWKLKDELEVTYENKTFSFGLKAFEQLRLCFHTFMSDIYKKLQTHMLCFHDSFIRLEKFSQKEEAGIFTVHLMFTITPVISK